MKIWPFDIYIAASGGHMISLEDLKAGLEVRRADGPTQDRRVG
jgi:hypothetical protein